MAQEIRVAIIEDQKPTREGLATLIGGTPGYRVTATFGSMEEALAHASAASAERPDVVLLDIHLPGMSGIDGAARLKERDADVRILVLTVYGDDDHVFEAICAGASGYLLKDSPPLKLLEAIRELHEGGAPMSPGIASRVVETFRRVAPPRRAEHNLSPRELEVLRLLAEGHSYKTAAGALGLAQDTVRFHVRHVYDKLHVHSKSEAVLKAMRSGLI
jgi:DNA-binding NarL/FixJ family response regulator